MRWVDILNYAASLAVLASFCMMRMMLLRMVAIGSNVLFALFGALAHIYPVLFLHVILLPINNRRLLQSGALHECDRNLFATSGHTSATVLVETKSMAAARRDTLSK